MDKICVICGSSFKARKKSQQCCSSECANIKAHNTMKKYWKCQWCGEMFWKPDGFRKKYCSTECQRQAYAMEHPKKEKEPTTTYTRICAWCGSEFSTNFRNHKYCSNDCAYQGNLADKREKWKMEYVPKEAICKECGTKFMTECGDTRSVFCCQSCADRYKRRQEHQTVRHKNYMREQKNRRDKQIRKQFVEPVSYDELYQRDNGICQICGMAVHTDKYCDDSWGGTIDHIVPLSIGGEHSMSNCQLSHRICNSLKGTSDDVFSIDWTIKSRENNYWRIKFSKYLELMRQQGA